MEDDPNLRAQLIEGGAGTGYLDIINNDLAGVDGLELVKAAQ